MHMFAIKTSCSHNPVIYFTISILFRIKQFTFHLYTVQVVKDTESIEYDQRVWL